MHHKNKYVPKEPEPVVCHTKNNPFALSLKPTKVPNTTQPNAYSHKPNPQIKISLNSP